MSCPYQQAVSLISPRRIGKRERGPYRAALQLMLTESASQYRLLPPLNQTFFEAETNDHMACSHSRAGGLIFTSIGVLALLFLRVFFHLAGYLTDEVAPLRNTPAVVGSYVGEL